MKKRYALWLALGATVLWLCFIYTRSSKPAVVSDQESGWVMELLQRLIPSISMRLVRKLAHFTEYAVLGGLLWLDLRLWGRGSVLLPLGAGLVFAVADELLQTFIPGRSGQVKDVLIDFCGVCFAVGLLWLIFRWRERKRAQKSHSDGPMWASAPTSGRSDRADVGILRDSASSAPAERIKKEKL